MLDFIINNWLYFAIGAGVLVLLIIIFCVVRHKKKVAKQIKTNEIFLKHNGEISSNKNSLPSNNQTAKTPNALEERTLPHEKFKNKYNLTTQSNLSKNGEDFNNSKEEYLKDFADVQNTSENQNETLENSSKLDELRNRILSNKIELEKEMREIEELQEKPREDSDYQASQLDMLTKLLNTKENEQIALLNEIIKDDNLLKNLSDKQFMDALEDSITPKKPKKKLEDPEHVYIIDPDRERHEETKPKLEFEKEETHQSKPEIIREIVREEPKVETNAELKQMLQEVLNELKKVQNKQPNVEYAETSSINKQANKPSYDFKNAGYSGTPPIIVHDIEPISQPNYPARNIQPNTQFETEMETNNNYADAFEEYDLDNFEIEDDEDDIATKKVSQDSVVINATPKLTLREQFKNLSSQQKSYFKKLRNYAEVKEGASVRETNNYLVIGVGNNPYIRLFIKKDVPMASFRLETEKNWELRYRLGNKEAKPKETPIKIVSKESFEHAKQLIDARVEQVEQEKEYKRLLRNEKRRKQRK